jgi:hypothetical protein
MTGELSAWLFGVETAPLPLLDPTAAAKVLGVARHSLACYRNRGSGPTYYRFGRWIRYLPDDLDAWKTRHEPRVEYRAFNVDAPPHALLDYAAAARFLTVTRFCLYSYRETGGGPPMRRFGRRIYYAVEDLLRWAEAQRQCSSVDSAGEPRLPSGRVPGA